MVPLPPGRGGHGRTAEPTGRRDPGRPGDGAGSLRQGRVCRGPGAVHHVHWPVRSSREVTIARAGRRGAGRARGWSRSRPRADRGRKDSLRVLSFGKRGRGDALVSPEAQEAGSRFSGQGRRSSSEPQRRLCVPDGREGSGSAPA